MTARRFTVTVVVETDTAEQAHQVLTERLEYEEELGYNYLIHALDDLTEVTP